MKLTVSNAIIITLGGVAYQMAQRYQQQIASRHPDLPQPTIAILPLLEEDARQAARREVPAVGVGIRPNDPEIRDIATQLYPHRTWPTAQNEFNTLLSNFPRVRGQIALHHHIFQLQQKLQQVRQQLFSTQTVDVLTQHKMQVANHRRLQVFILSSLADSFMTGILPDLPFIVQAVLREGAPEDTFVNIHLVLALPGFRGEVREKEDAAVNRDYARLRTYAQSDLLANAAACLREIDSLLTDTPRYQRKFGRFLTIRANHNPLSEGRIYLLEQTNEQEKSLDDIASLSSMVADWLYHATLTPLRQLFETPVLRDPREAYSSFGHSSLSVPIHRWVERVTVRHQIELLNELLSGENPTEADFDLSSARSQLHLTDDALRTALIGKTDYHDLRLQSAVFRGVPLAWAPQLLTKVQSKYTDLIGSRLTKTRGDIHYRKRQLTSKQSELEQNLVDGLESYVLRLLDDPHGGIIKAHVFLDALRTDLRQDRERLLEQRDQKRELGRTMGSRVDSLRNNYLGRAEVASGIGSLPFFNIVAMVGLLLVPLALLLRQSSAENNPALLWSVVGIIGLLSAITFGRTFTTLRTSRYRILKAYDDRLQLFREADLLNAHAQLYDNLIQWTGNLRQGINAVWEGLIDIRTELKGKWDQLADVQQLCGLASNRIAEYLLTPELIQLFEKRVPSHDLFGVTEALRQELGSPSEWVQGGDERGDLGKQLHQFCYARVARELERCNLREAIRHLSSAEFNIKFSRVQQLSYPYWRHDPTKDLLQEAPWQIVAVADSELDTARLFGSNLQRFDIQNPYELIVTTVRHGFALSEMNYFSQMLATAYQRVPAREKPLLHTTDDRLALPDPNRPIPRDIVIRTLPLRQLYALGRALDVIKLGQVADGSELTTSFVNHRGHLLPLANTPAETVFRLEQEMTLQSEVREAITQAWHIDRSLPLVQAWAEEPTDERDPEFWVRLAAQQFLQMIDEEALLV